MKISGLVLVPVLFTIHSRTFAVMLSHISGFVFTFPSSGPCSSYAFCTLLPVALIK